MTSPLVGIIYSLATVNELLISQVVAAYISELAAPSERPQFTGRTMVPLPRVMKLKLVPQFATSSKQNSSVSLHVGTTDAADDVNYVEITDSPHRVSGTPKCFSTISGALKNLLSKEIDRNHPCGRTADFDGIKVGIITCPCCSRKIEINLNLDENRPPISKSNTSDQPGNPTELPTLDYHGS